MLETTEQFLLCLTAWYLSDECCKLIDGIILNPYGNQIKPVRKDAETYRSTLGTTGDFGK